MIDRITHHSITKAIKCLSLTLSVVIYSLPALADQCAYLSKEQALQTVSRLKVGQTIYQLCEPCGETTTQPLSIESLAASSVGYQDFWEVRVNEAGIDLAYTFVYLETDDSLMNLAAVIGCPATGVSTVLRRSPDSSDL